MLQHAPALFGDFQRLLPGEMLEGMRGVNVADRVIGKGKSLAHIAAFHVARPVWGLEQPAHDRYSRKQDCGRVVEVVPSGNTGKSATDVDLD